MDDFSPIIIRKTIFKVDENRIYKIDVDATITFQELKKILASAAHLPKNGFKIFRENIDYTDSYDEVTLLEIFPDLQIIEFDLKILSEITIGTNEDVQITVKIKIDEPCELHKNKFAMLYCFKCHKSICSECKTISHQNHDVKEKADLLIPAKLLMAKIFSNVNIFRTDPRLSTFQESLNFRQTIKTEIFDKIRNEIDILEKKCIDCLELFSVSENATEQNTNANLELLHRFCIDAFIQLKNDINTKTIIIDEDIFLALYQKLKEIEKYKNEFFEINKLKYEKMNSLLRPFTKFIENMSIDIKNFLKQNIDKEIYQVFEKDIKTNLVNLIQKDQVIQLMFQNIGVPRKSLSRNSLNKTSYKMAKRNLLNSPEKQTNIKENNNLQKINDINENEKKIPKSDFVIRNINAKGNDKFSFNDEKNDNNINNNIEIRSFGGYQMNNLMSGDSMRYKISNKFFNDFQQYSEPKVNINLNKNNYGMYSEKKLISSFSKHEFDPPNFNIPISDMNNIKNISSNNENNNTIIENNLNNNTNINETNKNTNQELINQKIITNNNQIQQTQIMTQIPQNQIQQNQLIQEKNFQNFNINNQQIQSQPQQSNLFTNKLVDVLHNEISKNEIPTTQQIINNSAQKVNIFNDINNNNNLGNNINEKKTEITQTINEDGMIINKKTITTEKIIMQQENFNKNNNNNQQTKILFMYPVIKTNKIKAAYNAEQCEDYEIDFYKIFGNNKELPLKEFPECGAYCNGYGYLFFSGGKEFLKGLGKIFLRISIDNNIAKIVKMPTMNNNHYNHSMISGKNLIFVVGGYNSKKVEYYDMKKLMWFNIADLTCERQRTMLFFYKDYLYACMGFNQYGILDNIERINIQKIENNSWNIIKLLNPSGINMRFFGAGIVIPDNKNVVYFVGGKLKMDESDTAYKTDIYEFNFDNSQMSNTGISINGQLIFLENHLYEFNDAENNLGNFIDSDEGYLAAIPNLVM